MSTISIGATPYSNLRAAINALLTGDTIEIGEGSFAITPDGQPVDYNWTTLARFLASPDTIDFISIIGSGATSTTITGLSRIYASAKDSGYGLPSSWTIEGLKFEFNFTGTEYILQTGNRLFSAGEVVGASRGVTYLSLRSLDFSGSHQGSGAASGGAYSDLAGADNLFVEDITVSLTGQRTFTAGTATTLSSGGSAFLFVQGTGITIQNSTFNEGGYGNSLTIYDSSATVAGNIFDAQDQRKERGQVISNTSGSITGNQFLNGTHLDLLGSTNARKNLTVSLNTFDGGITSFGVGVVLGQPGQSLYNFRTTTITNNTFKDVAPIVSLIATPATGTTGGTTVTGTQQLTFGSNSVWNPIDSAYETFSNFRIGGTGADLLAGATNKDFIDGGLGNDTLSGGGAADAFAFTTPLNASTNVDTITDFKASGLADKIWLDNSIFTSLTPGSLDAADFGTSAAAGVDVVYSSNALYYAADGAATLSGYVQFAILSSSPSVASTDFVIF